MRNFRKLKVWKKSHQLRLNIYKCTKTYPKEEQYGLTSQMRRSASSIPSNIAEDSGRNTQAQFAQFLNIAFGSASELEYQIMLSNDLGLVDEKSFKVLTEKTIEIKRMLASLSKKVEADS